MGAVVAANIAANVLLKLGSSATGRQPVVLELFGWQFLAGIACFGLAVVLYAWSLRHLPLHLAQAIASLQFAGAVLAAHFLLGEAVSSASWLGILFILLGLIIVMR